MPVCCVMKKHCELSEKEWNDIAFLKDQHWPHGTESQKAWIARNFEDDDVHLLLYQADEAVAYASLNVICCMIDSRKENVLGLGGVCVAKTHQKQGLGKKIVECANEYITMSQQPGLLLCHKELTGFYNLCGWEMVNYERAFVAEAVFEHFVMSFRKRYGDVKSLIIPKNF